MPLSASTQSAWALQIPQSDLLPPNLIFHPFYTRIVSASVTQIFEKSALYSAVPWEEHPFHILKNLFEHRKVRYRGLARNTAQLHTLFALANPVIASRRLRT